MMKADIASSGQLREPDGERLDLDRLPGPNPLPYLGWLQSVVQWTRDPISYLDMISQGGYGNVVAFARGARRGIVPAKGTPGAVFLFGRDFHKQVMQHDDIFEGAVMMAPKGLGKTSAIFTALPWMSGQRHRRQRGLIFPMYFHRRISKFADSMVTSTQNMLDRLKVGSPVAMMGDSVEMLCEFERTMVLGMDPKKDGELAMVGDRTVPFFDAFVQPASHVPVKLPFGPRRRMLEWGDRVWDGFDALINAKRAAGVEGKIDAVSLLMQAVYEDGTTMTQEELVAESIHLFFAGWLTTRGPIAWIAYCIAQHPEVHANLLDELDAMLHGDAPTVEQLKQLPMLDWVVKEALRLMPPIFTVVRKPKHEVTLGGYRIPASTECWMSIYHTHREPDTFPDPLRFKPERWATVNPGPHGYLPYGLGERACAGIAMANMQLRIMFAMLVQRYRLETIPDATVSRDGSWLLLPKNDLRLMVRKQDREFHKSKAAVRGNVNQMIKVD